MATKLAFTTLRDDQGDALFWHSHWQRLCKSWEFFTSKKLDGELDLKTKLQNLWSTSPDTIVRVELLSDGSFNLVPRPILCVDDEPTLKICVADQPCAKREYPSWLKVGDYSQRLDAREKVKKQGFDDLLYLDESGYVTEASVANIIWLKNKKLFAPKESQYFLQGITTRLLQSKFSEYFEINNFKLDELLSADAAWLVNAVNAPMRITHLNLHKFATGVPELDLDQLYWQLVRIDRESRL